MCVGVRVRGVCARAHICGSECVRPSVRPSVRPRGARAACRARRLRATEKSPPPPGPCGAWPRVTRRRARAGGRATGGRLDAGRRVGAQPMVCSAGRRRWRCAHWRACAGHSKAFAELVLPVPRCGADVRVRVTGCGRARLRHGEGDERGGPGAGAPAPLTGPLAPSQTPPARRRVYRTHRRGGEPPLPSESRRLPFPLLARESLRLPGEEPRPPL